MHESGIGQGGVGHYQRRRCDDGYNQPDQQRQKKSADSRDLQNEGMTRLKIMHGGECH